MRPQADDTAFSTNTRCAKRYPQTADRDNTNELFARHLDVRDIRCNDEGWMELAQDCTNDVETLCSGTSRMRSIWAGFKMARDR